MTLRSFRCVVGSILYATILPLAFATSAAAQRPAAENRKPEPRPVSVKLGALPDIHLKAKTAADPAQAERIAELITQLTEIDAPDYGLSPTMTGSAFLPIAGQSSAGAFVLTDHKLKSSAALKSLVELGPEAVPFLLTALDDARPTKLKLDDSSDFGVIYHDEEMEVNPVNPAERPVERKNNDLSVIGLERASGYTLKVGDVCFVALGQIFGRRYEAIRYQPTAITIVNSPVHRPKLREAIRRNWASDDPRRKLFDSLRSDYATEGIFNGKSLDGWYSGSNFQCGAALRLLYYFPKEFTPALVVRLNELDVGIGLGDDDFMLRWVKNRVRTDEFVKGVAWSKEPDLRAAFTDLFRRAQDVQAMLAAMPAVDDVDLIRTRFETLLGALPAEERGPYGDGYFLLQALAHRTPQTCNPVFARYLKDAGTQRCHTVCKVLRESRFDGSVKLLAGLLDDRRTFGWDYNIVPGQNEPRRAIRICDEAAMSLSLTDPKFKFEQRGDYDNLDAQIAMIRKQLAQ